MLNQSTINFAVIILLMISCNPNGKDNNDKEEVRATLEYKIAARLGEGAIWNAENETLCWIDIEKMQLHIYDPKTKQDTSYFLGQRIGTVVPIHGDNVMVALESGICSYDLKTNTVESFVVPKEHVDGVRFNDGKCDAAGRLWVGSMHLKNQNENAFLYMVNGNYSYEKKLDKVSISNGIAWSLDNKTMYYIDTPLGNVRAFDYDLNTGDIANERIIIQIDPEHGFPDGMTIDEEGMLWIGMWNGNAVTRWNPETGKLLEKIEVPAHNVTSCAFGGKDLATLFITTATQDMSAEEKEKYPNAGSLFSVVPGVRGIPSNHFQYAKEE